MQNSILLDTHILIWLMYSPDSLNPEIKQTINDSSEVFVSIASFWEMAIKHKNGKLAYNPKEIMDNLGMANISILQIQPSHIDKYKTIQLPQSDPFDCMIVSQSVAENMILVTADKVLINSKYKTVEVNN